MIRSHKRLTGAATFAIRSIRFVETPSKLFEPVALETLKKTEDVEVGFYEKSVPGAVSGVPEEHRLARRVRIYQPTKMATQSGDFATGTWMIEYENRERWENSLMGWGSTGDPMSNLLIKFNTKEQAMQFAESMGYSYTVEEELPKETRDPRKSYGANFSWNKRTRTNTK